MHPTQHWQKAPVAVTLCSQARLLVPATHGRMQYLRTHCCSFWFFQSFVSHFFCESMFLSMISKKYFMVVRINGTPQGGSTVTQWRFQLFLIGYSLQPTFDEKVCLLPITVCMLSKIFLIERFLKNSRDRGTSVVLSLALWNIASDETRGPSALHAVPRPPPHKSRCRKTPG